MKKIVGQIARHYLGNRGTYLIGTLTLIGASKKYDVKKPCTPAILSPISSNDYELHQLTVSKGCQAHALSMGLLTFIAGNDQTRSGSSKQACVWLPPNQFRFLSSNEGLESSANWVSPLGHACGYSVKSDGRKVACSWRLDDWSDWSRTDFGETAGRHSEIVSGNGLGDIVGWASIHPTENGQDHFRPAIWFADVGGTIVTNSPEEWWGSAIGINKNKVGLIKLQKNNGLTCTFLWKDCKLEFAGSPFNKFISIEPKLIMDDDSIVCVVEDENRKSYLYRRYNDGKWIPNFEHHCNTHVACVGTDLGCAGITVVDGFRLPWIKEFNAVAKMLPAFEGHHHYICSVSAEKIAVGYAWADHCVHPLIWIPAGLPRASNLT